jgi:hypothetical protein
MKSSIASLYATKAVGVDGGEVEGSDLDAGLARLRDERAAREVGVEEGRDGDAAP